MKTINQNTEVSRLSPQQKRLWLSQQDGPACRAQCAVLLEGDLKREVLKEALQQIVNRHEILRTTFHRQPEMKIPLQVVADRGAPSWHSVDLNGCGSPQQKAKIEELFEEEKRRPFDFGRGPLLRLSLLALAPHKHCLLLSLPGLCADARTLKNLVAEISGCYAACAQDEELPDDPLQYADFSEWQHELLAADDKQAERGGAYWEKQEDGSALRAVKLPFEGDPGTLENFEPDLIDLRIDTGTLAQIEAVAGKSETSAAVILQTCWQMLLWRLTGQSEVEVVVGFDNRKYEETHDALGPYAKWLPVRCHFAANLTFREIVGRVAESVRDAHKWQEYFTPEPSGRAVVNGSDVPVSFEFAEQVAKHSAAGIWFSLDRQNTCGEGFKIKLSCVRAGDRLAAEIHYDPRFFERDDVRRIAACFETLLESALDDPGAAADELEMLSETDRHQLLVAFNQTTAEYPHDKCIHELFEQQAERTPDSTAVVSGDGRLTYAELNARANQLARTLRRRGVGPDVRVGLLVERSVEMLVGLLGILKAGGAYVPLNPEHPKARLAHQLAETQSPVLITQEKLLGGLPDFAGEVICLDRDRAPIEAEETSNVESAAAPQHLVYVIYTSGSTGVPKGTAISHQSLVNYTHAMCRILQPEESSAGGPLHFAVVSTISADLGNTCIFPSLVSGGCLHLIAYETAMDGRLFADYVSRHPVDVLKIVPSHLSALLASREKVNILPRKYLIVGGETLSFDLLRRIAETPGSCQIINHYGPTETTVGSLTLSLGQNGVNARTSASVPVGRPIANTEVYILDEHLGPVAVGTPGQLYIGGAGLARGYLNQPQQTAERFIPHPFSAGDDNARLYKTGDVARYLPDGNVEFLGRLDTQVKIRGYRVELEEIEAVLRQHAAVREAIVLAREDEPGHRRLVAYVVAHRKNALTVGELRSFLKEKLPEYMLPAAFALLDALPLTANGKVDRCQLPAPEEIRPESDYVAPRTEVERTVARIWQEALHVEKVGVDDNFFDLGGHSLLVVMVNDKLRGMFDRDIPVVDMFDHPTVSSLAKYLSQGRSDQPSSQPGDDLAEARKELIERQRQIRQVRWRRES